MKYTIQKIFGSYSICVENDYTTMTYYDVQKDIIDIIKQLEEERNNYKELYEKEKGKLEALKHIFIGKFNSTQDTIYLDILTDIMQPLEKGNKDDK